MPAGRLGRLGAGRKGQKGGWAFGLTKLETRVVLGGYRGMAAWADMLANEAKTGPWVPVDTSHLASNIRAGKVDVDPVAKFHVLVGTGSEVPYTRAQEMGSGLFAEFGPKEKIVIWAGMLNPGETKSLNPKMALAFKWEGGPGEGSPGYQTEGQWAGYNILGRVMHPGVRPHRFLRAAYATTAKRGRQMLVMAIKAQLTK
jgi:hypothetical protein